MNGCAGNDRQRSMKDENGRTWDIQERSFEYALRAIKLFRVTIGRGDAADRVLGKQFLRSATSVGANIEEAKSGESRADFIHKYGIAQKEARESLYWLRLIAKSSGISPKQFEPLLQETNELISIITTIAQFKSRRGLL